MAGLGAAHRLSAESVDVTVYEREPRPGGHTRSYDSGDGFIFDDGPHISFTKNKRVQDLLAESVGGKFEILQARVNNYWHGYWLKHPAQCNLFGLPADLVSRVLEDFVGARSLEPMAPDNYADWLVAAFGRTFAETFPMEYGRKYHTCPAEKMSTDWLGPRLYRPNLAEVLSGALSPETGEVHYVDHFRYPSTGGFESYLDLFLETADVVCEHEVVTIDPAERKITFANGHEIEVEAIVSSLPLPELITRIVGTPRDVRDAANRLACTTCVTVNLGIARPDVSDQHWTYLYDPDLTATRLSFPSRFARTNAPAGTSSIQAEVYFSAKYKPLTGEPASFVEPVKKDLLRCGLLQEGDKILHESARLIPYANVIFDLDRVAAVETIHDYLSEVGIATCGRYGEWGYHWTDESFESGENAAEAVLDDLRLG